MKVIGHDDTTCVSLKNLMATPHKILVQAIAITYGE